MAMSMQVRMEYPFPPSVYVKRKDTKALTDEMKKAFEDFLFLESKSLTQEETERFIDNTWNLIMILYDYLMMIEMNTNQPCLLYGMKNLLDQRMKGIR